MRMLLVIVLLAFAAPALGGNLADYLRVTPDSWTVLDAVELNGRIGQAVAAGETWPRSPLLLTLQLFGDDRELQSLVLDEVKNTAEGPRSSTVVYIRDGFLDDAQLGDWHEVDYRCLDDGTWRVVEARSAWRCRRPEPDAAFGTRVCP